MKQELDGEEGEELTGFGSESCHEVVDHRIEEWDGKILKYEPCKSPAEDKADGSNDPFDPFSVVDLNVNR